MLARQKTPADIRKRDVEAMCSDTLNPGGDVQICCVGCILAVSYTHLTLPTKA